MGLKNLGNSCYMGSVLQALMLVPAVQLRYAAPAQDLFASAPDAAATDFITQVLPKPHAQPQPVPLPAADPPLGGQPPRSCMLLGGARVLAGCSARAACSAWEG